VYRLTTAFDRARCLQGATTLRTPPVPAPLSEAGPRRASPFVIRAFSWVHSLASRDSTQPWMPGLGTADTGHGG
jgi:hypothetical protein